MHSNKTGNKSHMSILRYEQSKLANHTSVDFEFKNYTNMKLLWLISQKYLSEKLLRFYAQMVIGQKVGIRTWFWYQIKAVFVLLTLISET